jgi:hypothetical protein
MYLRMAWEVYWYTIRVVAGSCVEYLERYWPGSKEDGVYLQLYQKCALVDAALKRAFRERGDAGVEDLLRTDEGLEIALNSLACEWDLQLHGDAAATASLLAVRPPGMSDLLPQWAVDAGRTASRDVYRQAERVAYGGAGAGRTQQQVEVMGLRRRQGWLGEAVPTLAAAPRGEAKPKAKPKPKPQPKPLAR